ncbi:CBS and ACT domain-containing protein [Vagococcus vulneris]|uniref:CBS domain-containing protein n=1 Tax=Vagococcus vulneris TaxID=1977869 RepID=A0A430A1B7_9ENTE|nr:CBS and ACT domain-containing protein [Vagococcus vulneris]RSU00188.1 hypothetical protein CBF37_02515 [Vagococcus vulneris]
MFIKDFMTTPIISIEPEAKIFDAIDLMKEQKIHRLPVIVNGQLVGLLTEGTIQEALPSKVTSLSVYELNYLLNKTIVSDVMITDVKIVEENALLEDGIYLMRKNNIGVLPVTAETGEVIGIITNNDIFDAFLNVTGYNETGMRITVKVDQDQAGILAKLTQTFSDNKISIIQVIVYRKEVSPIIVFQTTSTDQTKIKELIEAQGYHVLSIVKTNPK